ncbi:FISUMP domain-containing protein [Elizabethkingia meningoseptica]|uniref:FISUMP domain-containing protein n=1 Tax=Elizabethkingia meningoseptica TaxID=238 RepID=UPI0022F1ABD9|nr:FISUMP domain-containing protein [Elizabethkingia meningoseptica]EJK5330255.1 hypothetical protein [Elizabethkingia meningoseptica]WBS73145.1 FISUMP domain-containing protein [Elizabethkingia meningoseptica]
MTKNKIKKQLKMISLGVLASSFTILASCRSSSETVGMENGAATVAIKLQGSSFMDEITSGSQASTKGIISSNKEQRKEIILKGNDDYKLVATLTPINNIEPNSAQASSKLNPIAATSTNPLANGVKYKVIVYDSNGDYVAEKDYSAGQENTTGPITGLNGGSTYTFIAYSIGSTTSLPPLYDNGNITSGTREIVHIASMPYPLTTDLMFFRTSMQVSGNSMNYLNINLLHKFNQIVTTFDSSLTGSLYGNQPYTIDDISAEIIGSFGGTSLGADGTAITIGDNPFYQKLTFQNLGSSKVTANPILINESMIIPRYNGIKISSVVLNANGTKITHKDLNFDYFVRPGVKYNLNLSFVPNDKYLDYLGVPAVRINGFIWMQQNLGATGTPGSVNSANIGNYYQWGVKTPAANGFSGNGTISGWNSTNNPPNNVWNTGSRQTPIKTANDPCPDGWRIASQREYDRLVENTTYSVIGNTGDTVTNPDVIAGRYASKTKPSVTITFPMAGYRDGQNGSYQKGGSPNVEGQYWGTSDPTQAASFKTQSTTDSFQNGLFTASANKSGARPIRCVAENP